MKKKGQKIIDKRYKWDLTQDDVCKKIRIPRCTLSNWERNGLRGAKVKNALKLAKFLECKIEDLL